MYYNKSRQNSSYKEELYYAIVKINVTYNNTSVVLTDKLGNVLSWETSGHCGFKGAKKSTPFAAQLVGEKIRQKIVDREIKKIAIEIKGPGSGRESALRAFISDEFDVLSIKDVTPLPHNGCRLPKKRRI